jgi:hypothetical protein
MEKVNANQASSDFQFPKYKSQILESTISQYFIQLYDQHDGSRGCHKKGLIYPYQ